MVRSFFFFFKLQLLRVFVLCFFSLYQILSFHIFSVRGQEVKEQEVSMETMECWCTEEQAMQVDIDMLQQVEALERRVVSAGLQVKVQTDLTFFSVERASILP